MKNLTYKERLVVWIVCAILFPFWTLTYWLFWHHKLWWQNIFTKKKK